MEHLTALELSQLKLGHSSMVQENAYEAIQALGLKLSECLAHFNNIQPGSLYHQSAITIRLAKALLSVGFNETNILFHGYSPLMTPNENFRSLLVRYIHLY